MSSLKKNIIYQIAYRVLTIITPIVTFPIVARALGANHLGIYSATQAFANYFMFLAMLGIVKYGQRAIAAASTKEKVEMYFWEIYSIQSLSSFFAISLYFIIIYLTAETTSKIMIIQSLWIVSALFDISWFFFGCGEFKITVLRNFIVKLITVFSIVLFVRDPADLELYALITAGGTAASQLLLWFSLFNRISFRRVKWINAKKHVVPIFRLFIPVIALSVYHIMDKTMLDLLSTKENVGYYYAVDKIINIPLGLILAIGTVMLTKMSYVIKNDSKANAELILDKSIELTMFMTCAVTFGIAAICKEFIPFFFGNGYEPCVELMYIFLPVLLIKALGDVVRTQYLIASGKDKTYIIAVISGAITNLGCNLILIPSLGAKGAVIGTFVAEFVVLLVQICGCIQEINFVALFFKRWIYLLNGVFMFLLVRLTNGMINVSSILLRLVIMVLVGALSFLVFCSIDWRNNKKSIFHPYLTKIIQSFDIGMKL